MDQQHTDEEDETVEAGAEGADDDGINDPLTDTSVEAP